MVTNSVTHDKECCHLNFGLKQTHKTESFCFVFTLLAELVVAIILGEGVIIIITCSSFTSLPSEIILTLQLSGAFCTT